MDPEQYLYGIPLIHQCTLFLPTDPWKELALTGAEAISQGFPAYHHDMVTLSASILGGRVDICDFFLSPSPPEKKQLHIRARELQLDPAALGLLLHLMTGIILTRRAQDTAPQLAPLTWSRGYCPICGNFPILAIRRGTGPMWTGTCMPWVTSP